MKRLFLNSLLVLILGCAPGVGGNSPTPTIDIHTDIERFLAAESPEEETRILNELKSLNVSNEIIKGFLTSRTQNMGPTGTRHQVVVEINGKKYPYSIFVPKMKPGTKLPLVIVLHGMGGSGERTIGPWVERLGGEFIVVCPSYPMGAWWTLNAEQFVLKLIGETRSQYPVDLDRVFLVGLSNGAIGAYIIGMFNPDYFAGIIPIAGSITPRYMHFLVNLKNTPLYLIHGSRDPMFPIDLSRRVNQILSDMGYNVVYREHHEVGAAHGGHFLPESEVPGMVEWLKQQKRDNRPKAVRMTREANHLTRIHWARLTQGGELAALDLPGPEGGPLKIRDGKIATLFALNKAKNEIEIIGKNLLEFEIYLSSDWIDFDAPVKIITQDINEIHERWVPGNLQVRFDKKVKPNLETLLREFKKRRDPGFLIDAKITISMGEALTLTQLR